MRIINEDGYLLQLENVLKNGVLRQGAKERVHKIDTLEVFGAFFTFDLSQGFPLFTSKRTWYRGVILELLWFLRGEDHIGFLKENNCNIWDKWADENGCVGPIYGCQWRNWNNEGIDQIAKLIQGIKENPCSRRHVISTWNVSQLDKMNLPPCHFAATFNVTDGVLNCNVHMRSLDAVIGAPFDIASYATLMHMISMLCNLKPGKLSFLVDSFHVYSPHVEVANTMIKRGCYDMPVLTIKNRYQETIDDFKEDDFVVEGYKHKGKIKVEVYD